MQTRQIDIAAFGPDHLDAATLARQVGWPHRPEDDLSLYQKRGLRETGRVLQHQGIAAKMVAPAITFAATSADFSAIAEFDRQAFGADRGDLIAYLAKGAELAVIRRDGRIDGFSVLRSSAAARSPAQRGAWRTPKHSSRTSSPCNPAGSSGWISPASPTCQTGSPSGALLKRPIPHADSVPTIFALANQAFG